MLTVSAEQVRTLAPDAAAARAGEALADVRRWSAMGRTDNAAWGLCQGSGAVPYQTAVDLGGPAYRCSCPSHKVPCKHALGLLFLLADGRLAAGPPPDWVAAWLDKRAVRAAKAAAGPPPFTPADPAGRARRVESREKKIAAGIDELDRWLADLMRRGLDSARGEGYRFWDAMGARLVDAQAAGLGRAVRSLGSAANAGDVWPHLLLEGAARLYLLCAAYRRLDDLPAGLRADVRSLVGWATREDEVDPSDTVDDRWLVVGRRTDDSGQIINVRTFVVGESSGRFALHLAFGVDAAPPTTIAAPGDAFRASLTFYPSATPLRALVRPIVQPDGEVSQVPGGATIQEVVDAHAERLAANPFLDSWPVAVRDVVPLPTADGLIVRQADGTAMPIAPGWLSARLLAVSGGHEVLVIGEWDGSLLRPLSVVADSRLVAFDLLEPRSVVDGGDGWTELVSAALLGTERTGGVVPLPAAATDFANGDPAERRLLGAAAVVALRRRAGRRMPVQSGAMPLAAEVDPRPALAGATARLLALVVADHHSLLGETLALLERSGRRLPDELLPAIVEATASDPSLREVTSRLGGARLRWLAGQLPELAEWAVGVPAGPERGADVDWDAAWVAADDTQTRAGLVRAMRWADAAPAREALARWLPDVEGDERARLVEALEERLELADEPLLESLLGDRRGDVSRAAADLLARLPASAFARLVEERARPMLAPHGRLRPTLDVRLPQLDAELEAAGFGGRPPAGLGERAYLLRQLLGHVRPRRWTEWLAIDPPGLVERARRSDKARPVLEGWIDATARFGDAGWAAALLAVVDVRNKDRTNVAAVIARLDSAGRGDVVARVANSIEPALLATIVAGCDAPWPADLTDAVFDGIGRLGVDQYPDQAYYELVRLAAAGVDPRRADELTTLASYDDQVRPALGGAIASLRLRARIRDAFAALPPLAAEQGRQKR